MRLVSVGRLIVAVAMAAQALVVLLGAMHGVAAGRDGATPICDLQRRHIVQEPSGAPQDRETGCVTCQSCVGGASPFPIHLAAADSPGFREAGRLVWPSFAHALSRPAVAGAHRARAPPLTV